MQLKNKYLTLSFALLSTAACQQPPAFDEAPAHKFEMKPVALEQGQIFMRRNTESVYQAPPKQIDVVRGELETLNDQLRALRGEVVEIKKDPLEETLRKVIAESQSETRKRLEEERMEKMALLKALDEKFSQVENEIGKLAQDDLAGRLKLEREKEALQTELLRVEGQTKEQKLALQSLRQNLTQEKELEALRQKSIAEGREMRLMEELALRKMLEENRRQNVLAESRRLQELEQVQMREKRQMDEKRQALQGRISSLQEKLTMLEVQEKEREVEAENRRIQMEERLQANLKEVQAQYDAKVQALKEANEKDVTEKLAALEEKHKEELKEAEEYRHAIEERIFAMESKGEGSRAGLDADMSAQGVQVASLPKKIGQLPSVDDPNIMIDEPGVGIIGSTNPADWVELGSYNVVVHEENTKLKKIVYNVLSKAEPFVGPWNVKWRLKKENMDVLNERFSLDAETTFDAFANYISSFMRSHRGFVLTFNIFESERVLVITDEVSQ